MDIRSAILKLKLIGYSHIGVIDSDSLVASFGHNYYKITFNNGNIEKSKPYGMLRTFNDGKYLIYNNIGSSKYGICLSSDFSDIVKDEYNNIYVFDDRLLLLDDDSMYVPILSKNCNQICMVDVTVFYRALRIEKSRTDDEEDKYILFYGDGRGNKKDDLEATMIQGDKEKKLDLVLKNGRTGILHSEDGIVLADKNELIYKYSNYMSNGGIYTVFNYDNFSIKKTALKYSTFNKLREKYETDIEENKFGPKLVEIEEVYQ